MSKADDVALARLEGMQYALKIALEKGIEALKHEIKMRGFLKCPVGISNKQLDDFVRYVKMNLSASYQLVSAIALNQAFGFGKIRLQRYQDKFVEKEEELIDLDYAGEHYVTMKDYLDDMNSRYGLLFDSTTIETLQHEYDNAESNKVYKVPKISRLAEELEEKGFQSAADYLRKEYG